jgi:putative autotransporter adhesin-like protein
MSTAHAFRRSSLPCAVLLLAVGCTRVTGSGRIVTKPVEFSPFSRIQVSDVFDVRVSLGQQEKVTLRVDDNLLDRVDIGVSGGTLHLGLKSRTSIRHATLHADVITRSLSGIEVSGASKVHLSREFTVDTIEATLSGASRIDGSLSCGTGRVVLSGASSATLSGTAERLALEASGASEVDAQRLVTRDLTIGLSGASDATVWATNTISAEVSGASSLKYGGSPRFIRKGSSGASDIEPL